MVGMADLQKIQRLLDLTGMKKARLAALIGVSRSTVVRWFPCGEDGGAPSSPKEEQLAAVAAVFGMSPEQFRAWDGKSRALGLEATGRTVRITLVLNQRQLVRAMEIYGGKSAEDVKDRIMKRLG